MEQFAELTLDLIDQGEFLPELREAFLQLQEDMIAFTRKHGQAETKGATGKLTVTLAVAFDGGGPGDFSILAQIKAAMPARPAAVGKAMASTTQTDRPTLYVQRSGSSHADPRQRVLATQTGETVDPETGEVFSTKQSRD
tara:strand:- start:701 stop:1120 length:420 start_codon:yes stop_codon:yes gene_type:complete